MCRYMAYSIIRQSEAMASTDKFVVGGGGNFGIIRSALLSLEITQLFMKLYLTCPPWHAAFKEYLRS